MKYTNPINFVLAIAALAFSVYVFSVTFLSSGPPMDLTDEEAPGALDPELSGSGAVPQQDREPRPGAAAAPSSGAAQTDLTGQQAPSRDRRIGAPPSTRNPSRPGGRTRPASRTDQMAPGTTDEPPPSSLPSGAVIPGDNAPSSLPSRRQIPPPGSVGSVQDRRPLPLRDRGGSKRQPDPDAPPPTRGSRQF